MCGACWTHWVDGKPWCASCVAILDEPVSWLAYVAASIFAISLGWIGAMRLDEPWKWVVLAVVMTATGLAAWRSHGRAKSRRAEFEVQQRTPDAEPPRAAPTGYRQGRAPVRVRRVAPPVSGALTAWIVGMLMALSAVAFPSALRLPRWLELEAVIGAWWVVWATTFVVLLFRGWRVAQDVKSIKGVGEPERKLPTLSSSSSAGSSRSKSSWLDALSGGFELDGCLILIGLVLLFCAAFVLAELVVPMLLIAAYWLIVRGLTTVANDDHGCEGNIGRAVFWGALWATAYTLPLAGIVFLVQWLR